MNQIAAGLLTAAASIAFASGTHYLRSLYRPDEATYARFHTDNASYPPYAECEGTCPGSTPHEDDGEGTATCTGCGTPRPLGPSSHLNGAS